MRWSASAVLRLSDSDDRASVYDGRQECISDDDLCAAGSVRCRLLFGQKLQKSTLLAACMMLLGIGLLSLDGEGGGLNIGDILTLVCGVFYGSAYHCC